MTSLVDTLQAVVRQELGRLRIAELGVVESVHPHTAADDASNYGCDVRLKNSSLLLKRVPVATGHVGTAALPGEGDLVLLAFDKGDVNQPIVVGRLYDDQNRPPLHDCNEVVFRLPLAEADDKSILAALRNHPGEDPAREIQVAMPPKITLQITEGTVKATAGKTEVALDQQGSSGGSVTLHAGGTRITLDQDGDVTLEAAGAMTLKAKGDLSLEGQNVSIKGRAKTDLEAGTQATCKAKLGATLDGGVGATVQGTSVTLKGISSFSP